MNWLHIYRARGSRDAEIKGPPAANQRVWSLCVTGARSFWLCHFCTWPTPVGNIQIRARLIRYWSRPPASCMVQHTTVRRKCECAAVKQKGMINRAQSLPMRRPRAPPAFNCAAVAAESRTTMCPLRVFSLSAAGGALLLINIGSLPRCQCTWFYAFNKAVKAPTSSLKKCKICYSFHK